MSQYTRDPKLWASQRPAWAGLPDSTDDNDPSLPPRPLPNSYWASPTLLASEYPGGPTEALALPRLTALVNIGLTDFFDLTEEGELVPYAPLLAKLVSDRGGTFVELDASKGNYPAFFQIPNSAANDTSLLVRYARFPIRDRSIPSREDLHRILDALSMVHAQPDRKAVVHCWGGIGRTGTIVGCWLVHSGLVQDVEDVIVAPMTEGTSLPVEQPGDAVPVAIATRVKPAGEVALGVLAKKWQGVDKSWRVPRTPENALQADVVRLHRPPARGM
ncbi:hypothetical protein FRB90_004819 [Tulasnella sp. 427]|nr:hypothetical protein FRB90_004819 [Tulasnella sp. 427]